MIETFYSFYRYTFSEKNTRIIKYVNPHHYKIIRSTHHNQLIPGRKKKMSAQLAATLSDALSAQHIHAAD